jgi:hypothetical protein
MYEVEGLHHDSHRPVTAERVSRYPVRDSRRSHPGSSRLTLVATTSCVTTR